MIVETKHKRSLVSTSIPKHTEYQCILEMKDKTSAVSNDTRNQTVTSTGYTPEGETHNTIKTPYRTFSCKKLLQGDTNTPSRAIRVMEYFLDRLIGKTVLAYLDDITIFSVTLENPVGDIHQVFQRVWDNNMRACPSKCNFLADRLPRLEHVIDDKGIQADLEKIRGLPDWHTRNRKMNYKLLLVL